MQIIDESRIPKRETEEVAPLNEPANEEAAKAVPKPTTDADDDDEYDLALFRHSTTSGPPPAPAGDATTTLTALASLESAKSAEPILQEADLAPAGPSYLPASATSNIKDAASSLVEIRHLTLSETYKPTKGVEGQILAIAVQSAFQTSANIKYVLIRLDPKLDKTFRMHALKGGFQIMRNDIPLESGLDTTSLKDAVEALARKVWPLSFESEFLMLDKEKWQMPSN